VHIHFYSDLIHIQNIKLMQMKRIIVPTDFSECASNAIRYAIQVASLIDAQLEIICLHSPEQISNSTPIYDVHDGNVDIPDSLITMMNELKKELSNHALLKFEIHINNASALDTYITEFAKKNEVLLVIMGTEGAHDYINYFSNTSELMEKRKVAVLAIPAGYLEKLEPNSEFVFATDFKDINNWEIMNVFRLLAIKLEATINVFYVHDSDDNKDINENQNFLFHDLEGFFEGILVELHQSSKANVVHEVDKFAISKKASLIMMIAHDRSWLSELFHKSVNKEMALHTQVPFLSLPDKHLELNKSAEVGYW